MPPNVRQVLRDALEAKGWSVERLRSESGVECDRSSLHRKIYGIAPRRRGSPRQYQPLSPDEVTSLARALGVYAEVKEYVQLARTVDAAMAAS